MAFKKGADRTVDWDLTNDPYPTWRKLEELVQKGKIRNIGISKWVLRAIFADRGLAFTFTYFSFNIQRIQNLTSNPLKIKPAVNQVELSYWNPQPELVKVTIDTPSSIDVEANCRILQWSKENNLLLEAYSPLGSAEKVKESLEIPEAGATCGVGVAVI